MEEIGFGKFHIILTIVLGFAWVSHYIIIFGDLDEYLNLAQI